MFESLTPELMVKIQSTASRVKKEMYKYDKYTYAILSVIQITAYRTVSELRRKKVEITSDVETAAKVYSALPMSDKEFFGIMGQYNSDYELIAQLYCIDETFVKSRYKLALIRRRKLIEKAQQNPSNPENSPKINKKTFSNKN